MLSPYFKVLWTPKLLTVDLQIILSYHNWVSKIFYLHVSLSALKYDVRGFTMRTWQFPIRQWPAVESACCHSGFVIPASLHTSGSSAFGIPYCLVCRFQKETESGAQYLSALNSLALGIRVPDTDISDALVLVTAAETSQQCVKQLQQIEEVMAISYRQKQQSSRDYRNQPSTSRNAATSTSASTAYFFSVV